MLSFFSKRGVLLLLLLLIQTTWDCPVCPSTLFRGHCQSSLSQVLSGSGMSSVNVNSLILPYMWVPILPQFGSHTLIIWFLYSHRLIHIPPRCTVQVKNPSSRTFCSNSLLVVYYRAPVLSKIHCCEFQRYFPPRNFKIVSKQTK